MVVVGIVVVVATLIGAAVGWERLMTKLFGYGKKKR